jgi:uncharacterized membrane protein
MNPSIITESNVSHWRRQHWLIVLMVLAAWVLVTAAIQRPSYWIDEKISMDIASADSFAGVIQNVADGERRPPAYHLGLWAITTLGGQHERVGRLYSAMWVVLFVPAAFQLARHFGGIRAGVIAATLAASSSLLMSYGQIIRYYTMVATLAALSYATFFALARSDPRRAPSASAFVRYLIPTVLLIACDFPAYGVLAAQNALVFLLLARKRTRTRVIQLLLPRWVFTQGVLAAVILVWMPVVLHQRERDFGAADLSNSIAGALLRLAYPFYAWFSGENLFPWSPVAILVIIASCLAAVLGLTALARLRKSKLTTWLIAFLIPFTLSQYLLSTVASDSPFVNAAARSMSVMGLLLALVACGIAAIRRQVIRMSVVVVIVAGNLIGLVNYYNARDTINPIYSTPAREAAQWLSANYKTGDIVITESDTMVATYLPQEIANKSFTPDQHDAVLEYARANPRSRVWLVTLGRDRTRNETSENLAIALENLLPNRVRSGFAEQDALYRALKSRLLSREVYRYRLSIDRFAP